MDKASKILNLIGYIFEILLGVIFVLFFITSIIILTPNGTAIIREGLISGRIAGNPALSLEENINYIHNLFVVATIIFFILMALFVTESIFAIIVSRKGNNKKLIITSLILSILSLNAILIVANILLLKDNEEETIIVS